MDTCRRCHEAKPFRLYGRECSTCEYRSEFLRATPLAPLRSERAGLGRRCACGADQQLQERRWDVAACMVEELRACSECSASVADYVLAVCRCGVQACTVDEALREFGDDTTRCEECITRAEDDSEHEAWLAAREAAAFRRTHGPEVDRWSRAYAPLGRAR